MVDQIIEETDSKRLAEGRGGLPGSARRKLSNSVRTYVLSGFLDEADSEFGTAVFKFRFINAILEAGSKNDMKRASIVSFFAGV